MSSVAHRRQRLESADVNLMAGRDYIATHVSDSVLLSMANVRVDESATRPKTTLFGPWVEQPKSSGGSGSLLTKKPLPVEKKIIPQDVVQSWVERAKDVSTICRFVIVT